MGLFEKIAGGAVGFAVGGPLGAVLGAVAGEAIGGEADERAARRARRGLPPEPPPPEEKESVFLVSVVSLLAKLAKADGRVSRKEIAVIDRFFKKGLGLSGGDRKAAIRIFEAAKSSEPSYEDLAIQVYQLFREDPASLKNLMTILIRVGAADGEWHPAVDRKLTRIARIFDFSEAELEQMRSMELPDHNEAYEVLGVAPDASAREIKKAYKRLCMDFHPDRIATKDLPPAFREFAEERFRAIQEAYEALEARR